ncbi:MAG TPA: 4-(cytidine 5'-diphospho)-2-C-methyl-D-erythritol kinase [Bacteroidia bacterium]|nr:4-(cytidine 5'-diphospho)-2-C-methyl-D-erythritol kinase [Bacteroidia bacterium]QQR95163.1 MAG: 4-(cytidine 5'-diphospho)-2-C-methyl-D-erythritol kinase [Bacteroidota bacterium]MBP7714230.1 4-(cytidine 5'-diphospho)-2-C-methyl-D-erythritol kinase [Bacteroidia bacterium]MBP8669074.1 4-(cytidine 5'-diphospho)-2-C-methyl-D-erythritol kinase [Bacteroidia bacterium]HOZ81641.1 4-(cytidine 5'-diphospho)-2-C-methyl-D-erythritol kinase [Bacteroidia bacterium]
MLNFPNAKINLGLFITSRFDDGYHALETLFYPINWCDILEITENKNYSKSQPKVNLYISGLAVDGPTDQNLCSKAYHLLKEKFNLPPVNIFLHKQIPTGAGLGGGSSDGAHTLLLLNKLFDLKLSNEDLSVFALNLGSDCPFFISNKPSFAFSKGEILKPAPTVLEGNFIVVIKPSVSVSTAMAYSQVKPDKPNKSLTEILNLPKIQWKDFLKNDFEKTILPQFPQIEKLKTNLYQAGAYYASMSGSGSAVFGLFHDEVKLSFLKDEQHHSAWL